MSKARKHSMAAIAAVGMMAAAMSMGMVNDAEARVRLSESLRVRSAESAMINQRYRMADLRIRMSDAWLRIRQQADAWRIRQPADARVRVAADARVRALRAGW